MTTWRDDTPQDVQDELDGLLSAGLDAAEEMLAKRGEFFPLALALDTDGVLALRAADPGLGEQPPSAAVLEALREGLASERGELRAVAFVYDVSVAGGDAVTVDSEHSAGPALTCRAPYQLKGRLRRSVAFGDLSASPGPRHIWP